MIRGHKAESPAQPVVIAVRDSISVGNSVLHYRLQDNESIDVVLSITESSEKVDGIGGIVWEGSLVLCEFLKRLNRPKCRVIELGCGVGLCSLVTAAMGIPTIATDRETDLVVENINRLLSSSVLSSSVSISAIDYHWQQGVPTAMRRAVDSVCEFNNVIIGVEVACLLKQQPYLVDALCSLYTPQSVILITIDGEQSKYEANFMGLMREKRFLSYCIYEGSVTFSEYQSVISLDNLLADLPPPAPSMRRSYGEFDQCPGEVGGPCGKYHKVVLFYRSSAVHTCRKCQSQYFNALNRSDSCVTHSGYFVCRKHPAEIRLSVDGLGDGLGYYGNGTEGTHNLKHKKHKEYHSVHVNVIKSCLCLFFVEW